MRKIRTIILTAALFANVFVANGGEAFATRRSPEARDLPPEIAALIQAGDLGAALAAAEILDREPLGGYGLIWPTSLVFSDDTRLHGAGLVGIEIAVDHRGPPRIRRD